MGIPSIRITLAALPEAFKHGCQGLVNKLHYEGVPLTRMASTIMSTFLLTPLPERWYTNYIESRGGTGHAAFFMGF